MPTVRPRKALFTGAAVLAALWLSPAAVASSGGATAPTAAKPGPAEPDRAGSTGGGAAARERARPKRRRRAKPRRVTAPVNPAPAGAEAVFPVGGVYDLGGEGARFGAQRPGHIHQGQDIAAAEGTPVLAPSAGTVEVVRYQRAGAGWYVVLDGDEEDRDYVFMHLRSGSVLVAPGQQVEAGAQLAEVGNTGSSSGAHLHFEVWVGGWLADGGAPIDPLPLLRQWAGGA